MGRPPRRLVSREGIMRAALALVDEEGPDALSTTRVARRLGVKGPSLYAYVSGRDEIVDGLHALIVAEMDLADATGPWTEVIDRWARSYRAAFAAHPRAVPLIAARPVRVPAALEAYARAFEALRAAGWPEERLLPVVRSVEYFLTGSALDLDACPDAGLTEEHLPPGLDPFRAAPAHHRELAFETGLAALIEGLRAMLAEVSRGAGGATR
ncbi:TetR/AcrR family transcriptional regulator [Streptomyces albidoflavus]|uniref:TetR/AcrR family transcriptional regulator n=1 Tax=unclassified Streptomyces TaxID=2593676 RepID=UPI0003A60A37|nr:MULTISPECIES: TetR/AcrR family transcriptional regulator C-terminal domain-containing protein [unclassified Streptomyces]MYQ70080.1 TetR family transcriptional regulator [Streptomyces sp. SID4934]MYW60916.1 TetR family transcriptional regulator [Streptomyces sp. SID8370]MYW85016.1 TetR family transcriptional regulator [Streptomyces sp. SID8371]MDI3344758.1 TetR/AcrR family transcriptional regulator C-terminal domain-containing protein [Streptomyces sp. AJ-1]SCD40403.1 transcriptional regula